MLTRQQINLEKRTIFLSNTKSNESRSVSLANKALERAEIHELRFHDLRHEATSHFVEAGLSDKQVSSITGHKSMQMLRRHTHLRTEDLVSKISNI